MVSITLAPLFVLNKSLERVTHRYLTDYPTRRKPSWRRQKRNSYNLFVGSSRYEGDYFVDIDTCNRQIGFVL